MQQIKITKLKSMIQVGLFQLPLIPTPFFVASAPFGDIVREKDLHEL